MAITLDGSNGITTDIASNESATFNRDTTDGDLIILQKDNATVGSIGSNNGVRLGLGTSDTGIKFYEGDSIDPCNPSTAFTDRDAAIDLGRSDNRFKDLYLSGGVYVGGTGAANYLDDYEEGTWSPIYSASNSNPTITYAAQTEGSYTKIGNLVYVSGRLRTDSLSGGSGDLYVSNLPFQAQNVSQGDKGAISVGYSANFNGDHPSHGTVNPNTTSASWRYRTSANGGSLSLQATDLNTGSGQNDVIFSGFYFVA